MRLAAMTLGLAALGLAGCAEDHKDKRDGGAGAAEKGDSASFVGDPAAAAASASPGPTALAIPAPAKAVAAEAHLPAATAAEFPLFWRDELGSGHSIARFKLPAQANGVLDSFAVSGISLTASDRVVAFADLNGDGKPDLLVQSYAVAGPNLFAYMATRGDGTGWDKVAVGVLGGDQHAVGVADFTGDGKPEIIVRTHGLISPQERARRAALDPPTVVNSWEEQGALFARTFANGKLSTPLPVGSGILPTDWRCTGASKLGSDTVIVFQHRKTGQIAGWRMSPSAGVLKAMTLAETADPVHWDLIGPAFSRDTSTMTLLFRDNVTSALLSWKVDGNFQKATGATLVPAVDFRFTAETGEPDFKHTRRQFPQAVVEVPKGQTYKDNIPDTLDLAQRADLAIHAMIATLDPADEDNMLWEGNLINELPWMRAGESSAMNAKFFEAMPLLRRMTGSTFGLDYDKRALTGLMRDISRQGIYMMPLRDRAPGEDNLWYDNQRITHTISVLPQARFLSVLTNYYKLMGKHALPPALAGERLLAGIDSISVKRSGYYEFAYDNMYRVGDGRFAPVIGTPIPWELVSTTLGDGKRLSSFNFFDHAPRLIYGPADYFRTFDTALGATIATNFSQWILAGGSRMFDLDGTFHPYSVAEMACLIPDQVSLVADKNGNPACPADKIIGAPHFAVRSKALNAMLTAGIATKNQKIIDFVEASYLKARNHPASKPELGYFPEHLALGTHVHQQVETDEVADMIDIATNLSRYVPGKDYWDDVDHYVRNQFAEMQLTEEKLALMKNFRADIAAAKASATGDYKAQLDRAFGQQLTPRLDGGYCSIRTEDSPNSAKEPQLLRCKSGSPVIDDSLGAWGSYSSANSWGRIVRTETGALNSSRFSIMNCCLASAARTLHVVWDGMYEKTDDAIKVHLLLNRAAADLDVYSWLPYHGRVDIRTRASSAPNQIVEVRMPDGQHDLLDVKVRNANKLDDVRDYTWEGRYIRFATNPGEQLRIDFKMSDNYRVLHVDTGDEVQKKYTFRFRGNQAVAVDPPGTEVLNVDGQPRATGVPFYASFKPSIEPGSQRWIPKEPGLMLKEVIRYLPER